jgi:hypothetical protein
MLSLAAAQRQTEGSRTGETGPTSNSFTDGMSRQHAGKLTASINRETTEQPNSAAATSGNVAGKGKHACFLCCCSAWQGAGYIQACDEEEVHCCKLQTAGSRADTVTVSCMVC